MRQEGKTFSSAESQQAEEKDYQKMYYEVLNEKYDLLNRIEYLEKFIKAQAEYIAKLK